MYNRPYIAYVGPLAFPEGGAAARRILGNVLSLRQIGYHVIIGTGKIPPPGSSGFEFFKGIPVHSLSERTAEKLPTLLKHLVYFNMGKKTVAWLNNLNPRPCAVILYSGYSPYLMRLLPWCKKNCIPLVFDAVEWYDPSGVPGGRYSPYRWNIELAMRYYCPRAGNIIAISTYLEKYFIRRGCITVHIPPTLDVLDVAFNIKTSSNPFITIGYTGTPGHKDLFDNFLEGILRFDPQGRKLRLRIAGITKEQLLGFPAIRSRGYKEIPTNIETIGKVSQPAAISLIRQVDFSILLRPPLRYAQAGFPTKVVESLAVGTPVICNLTSDIGNYIRDGIEGIICEDYHPESLVVALSRATKLSAEERRLMRIAARKQAEHSFDYRRYVSALKEFIRRISREENKNLRILTKKPLNNS